jgi:2-hydroxychromene-2-carboxylate isomerase
MPRHTLDFWFEFASTYSYPAAMRIAPLATAAGVTVRWRPFLLGPIFKAQGWDTSPFNLYPDKGRYMWRDLERLCVALNLPFTRPDPFPQWSLLPARVAIVGLNEGWGEDFVRAVYRAEFGEGRSINEPAVIGELVSGLGVDAAVALERAQTDANKANLRAQIEEARRLGIFGAPSFVTDGELFWGNDRLEQAIAWAKGP